MRFILKDSKIDKEKYFFPLLTREKKITTTREGKRSLFNNIKKYKVEKKLNNNNKLIHNRELSSFVECYSSSSRHSCSFIHYNTLEIQKMHLARKRKFSLMKKKLLVEVKKKNVLKKKNGVGQIIFFKFF